MILLDDALVGFRFVVFVGPISMGFKSVSGISRKIETQTYQEGGVNDYVHSFVKPASSEGVLNLEKGAYAGVYNPFYLVGERIKVPIIMIVNSNLGLPLKTYTFSNCIVKSWTVSDFDATRSDTVIDKFEVTYDSFIVL